MHSWYELFCEGWLQEGAALTAVLPCCRVELRTQEAERGMNSEEAEKLVWAAQTIFATGCERAQNSNPQLPLRLYAA